VARTKSSNSPFPKKGSASSSELLDSSSASSQKVLERRDSYGVVPASSSSGGGGKMHPLEVEPLITTSNSSGGDQDRLEESVLFDHYHDDSDKRHSKDSYMFHIRGRIVVLTRRQTGILGAVINGAWGGMNLIPLHYAMARDGLSGAAYLISYATGSLIVNAAIWVLWIAYYYLYLGSSWEDTAAALPKFHLEHLFWPGLWAGLLYSTGNFASILAVAFLGQGTGFSFCMMQLFVSGLWGVFYFHEIRGRETVLKWFASAAVAVTGIIWLSYEHEGESVGHR